MSEATFIAATQFNVEKGSKIKLGAEEYFAYKVNKTFIWGGKAEYLYVEEKIALNAKKSVSFVETMKQVGARKIKYSGLQVFTCDDDFKKEDENRKYLKPCCLEEVRKLYDRFTIGKTYRYPVECFKCSTEFHAVEADKNHSITINSDGYIFKYSFIKKSFELVTRIGEFRDRKDAV